MIPGILAAVLGGNHIPEVDGGPVLADEDVVDAHALLALDHVLHGGLQVFKTVLGAAIVIHDIIGIELIDPLHLGVVLVLNLMIGLCTPPVGTSLFICAKTANITIEKMYKAILPFLVPLIIVLFLITYVPSLVTWLLGTLG